jgi:hypothetical protein
VPAFRVAYCNSESGEFTDVVEKYFNLKSGHQILSVRIGDCVTLRGNLTCENMTSVRLGGFVQQIRSSIFITAKLLHADSASRVTLTNPTCASPE